MRHDIEYIEQMLGPGLHLILRFIKVSLRVVTSFKISF